MTDRPPRPARYAGLDGMRAIAVALVIVYHLFPGWVFAGGFVGVDVFFVISGFLITSLLLVEHRAAGRIDLRAFWTRRARRLAPALLLVVTVCASVAWLVGGDVLARMGAQILGAVTFSYNWVSIAGGSDYFAATSPELFRNLWSLAVEEQFYVLWPVVLPLLLLVRSRVVRVAVVLLAAGASAAWMAQVIGGGDLTRAYFGTDTHAFGILIGVALALVLRAALAEPPSWMLRRPAKTLVGSAGVLALAALLVVAALPAADSAATFPGAMLAASLLTAVVITAATWPGAPLGRCLDVAPLRWVGDRSYGLYLWHWPVLVLLAATSGATPAEVPLTIAVVTLVVTVVAAELSYRLWETPVRRRGFRGAARAAWGALRGSPQRRLRAVAAAGALLLMLGGTTAAIAAAPAETSAESAVRAGIDALNDAQGTQPDATPTADPLPVPTPVPTPVGGTEITAVGDSVMLASAPALVDRFPGIQVDAAVSRSMYAGPGILEQLASAGQLRRYVVVALGTNGAIDRATLDEIERIVGPDRELVVVNAHAPRDWIAGVNSELQTFAADYPTVELADWSGAIGAHEDLLAGDRIHPGSAGGRIFADTVAAAVDTAQKDRLDRQYALDLRSYELNRRLLGSN
ncbi:acyltransferase family protein [Microbacterium sp. A1-JK]|uniref:acyltransferase family protein n=1 Tax=Microbacterium sp. A1-JK TaxID=3177516 RepID=UPI00388A4CD8